MNCSGVDAPDMRFSMLLQDISSLDNVRKSQFGPIKNALVDCGILKAVVVKNAAKET